MDNNQENKTTVICSVCGGKGGWKKKTKSSLDNDWVDCLYCNGYGFHMQDTEIVIDPFLLEYNSYRKKITEILSDTVARVESFNTLEKGKIIEIRITPYSREVFSNFVEFVLRLGYYSTKIQIQVVQDFYFKPTKNKYAFNWKIVLEPNELSDLDGFIDVIKLWEKKGGL